MGWMGPMGAMGIFPVFFFITVSKQTQIFNSETEKLSDFLDEIGNNT